MKEAVIPVFDSKVTFSEVRKIMLKENLSMSAKWTREVVLRKMSEEHRHYLQDKIFYLKLLDVALHARKRWTSWELKDMLEAEDRWVEENILRNEIQHCFTRENLFGVFQVILQQGIFWILICLKSKNLDKGIKYHSPLYFAYVPGDVYLFTIRTIPKDVFKLLTKSVLGYSKVHKCLLTGHSVSSLFKLLKNKEQKAVSWRDVDEKFLYRSLSKFEVVESSRGLNFVQSRKRQTYAKNCIGEDPPVIDNFVIKADDNKWKGGPVVPHFMGKNFDTVLILKSKHVSYTVEKLIVYGVITSPAPPHFEKLNSIGSNDLLIVPDESVLEEEGD
ncbi:uncharacterized protein LOC134535884 isoform X2 [Bacillus rossius redtenbacheri]